MSNYYRQNPDEPIQHEWIKPGIQSTLEPDRIVIESGIPFPNGNGFGLLDNLRQTLASMKPGQSFKWAENKLVYKAAQQTGLRVVARKTGDGYRVWLIGPRSKHPPRSRRGSGK